MPHWFRFALFVACLGLFASESARRPVVAAPPVAAPAVEVATPDQTGESTASDPLVAPLGELGPDQLMCCDQPSRPNDRLGTVSKSALVAGTAAGGLALVGRLIKRRRSG